MGFAEYGQYDALGLAELVRTGQVTPIELLDEALARVALVNPRINAVIHVMEDKARAAIASGLPEGAFTRRTVPDQGPHDGLCRRADALRLATVQGFRAGYRR